MVTKPCPGHDDNCLVENKVAVVVLNPLGKVDVGGNRLSVQVIEFGTQDRDLAAALDAEMDVPSGLAEVHPVPLEPT